MRPVLIAVILVLSACSVSGGEPVSTAPASSSSIVPSTVASTTITTTVPTTTSTTAPTTTTSTLASLRALAIEPVVDLEFPTNLVSRLGSRASWITTKDGRVWEMTSGVVVEVIDIRSQVRNQGEQGLLGIALSGDLVYLHYTADDGDTVVSEFAPNIDGAYDERILFRADQPASNHNGGWIQLGPDGALYLALGDGGGANDQFGNGQNTETLLGGIVRLDVDSGEADLWAYGLRNPWRFWIDEPTDMLYIGDVGQGTYEEIDAVLFADAFYNFGWPITEGLHCFSPRSDCPTEGITLPVVEYSHAEGCSVTGGVVYRGSAIPEIEGHYLYSDFCGGWLRSFRLDHGVATEQRDWSDDVGPLGSVVSFGVDGEGEVYVLTTGSISKLVPQR